MPGLSEIPGMRPFYSFAKMDGRGEGGEEEKISLLPAVPHILMSQYTSKRRIMAKLSILPPNKNH